MHLSAPWRIFRSPTCHVIYEYYRCRTNPLEDRPRELCRPEHFVHWLSMLRHFVIYLPSPFRGAPPVDLSYESQGCESVTTSIARSHLRVRNISLAVSANACRVRACLFTCSHARTLQCSHIGTLLARASGPCACILCVSLLCARACSLNQQMLNQPRPAVCTGCCSQNQRT